MADEKDSSSNSYQWRGKETKAIVNVLSDEESGLEMAAPTHTNENGELLDEGGGTAERELDDQYSESDSKFRRGLALLTNPFYNRLKGNLCRAHLLLALRSALVLFSILGAILQVSEAVKGECFVYSKVGGFTNFPKDVSASLYFRNILRLNTVVCSSSKLSNALNASMRDANSFKKCGVAGYDATSVYDDSGYLVTYMNFRRSETSPYGISEVSLTNITRSQCLGNSTDLSKDVLSLTEEDRCGLTAWVKAKEATFGPTSALVIMIILCFVVAVINWQTERNVFFIIGPNAHMRGLRYLGTWRNNVTKIPHRVRFSRLFSSNIWYTPFVTQGKVSDCFHLTRFQSSFPISLALGIFAVIALILNFRRQLCLCINRCCTEWHSKNWRRFRCTEHSMQEVLSRIGAVLVLFQLVVHIIGNWRLITGLVSNTSLDELGKSPVFDGVAETGKSLLQIGGWGLAVWDLLDLLVSTGKATTKPSA